MNLKFFCPRWGSENLSWNDFLQKIKEAGFSGVEYAISNSTTHEELNQVWELAEQLKLEVIPQHYETADPDFSRHHDTLAAWFEKVSPYQAPKIDCQTGRDFFSFEQNKQLIELAAAHTRNTSVKVYHETHRSKFAFAAHVTKEYLTRIPELEITLDASHWVNVAETYLDEQHEAMELAISRTGHIHARVGYPEGPQVPDPRVPEWQEAVEKHLAWWDKVADKFKAAGTDFTITPEFGPFPYMVPLPFTRQPITDQWEVNVYMMQLLRDRYQNW
ncbi:sugar phosphate isomerase/epimerase [Botryobacter ruber]|uniref:sugar phosphate isomerase/epimerase n=1 Tax=Botryobacter ruber TaxID=2171629 RepID=UPI000E0BE0AE|nr:sugar phosphate isomerase/epimerase [Botryobacter ruber]